MPNTEKKKTTQIQISRIETERLLVPVVGLTPLIVNRFSEKSKRTMLDGMQGVKTPKTPKDPEGDYEGAFYLLKDGETRGFPANGFKQATVAGGRFYGNDVTMVGLRQFMFFHGEIGPDGQQLVVIEGEPHMREDVVKVKSGGTDLRYRPCFNEWQAVLDVTYVVSSMTRDSLVSFIDAGGMSCGVGEWRPEKKGEFGTYTVDVTRDIEVIGG